MPIISNSKVIFLAIFFYIFCLFPLSLRAQIIITEIMYNPEGTDSGREWVEVYNTGSESVDISNYKLLENEVNHRFSAHNPDNADALLIEAGEYAIIADNSTKFLDDYSESGLLVDSAFSLRNDGEEISITDSDGNILNTVNYSPDWGADGTGNSLQLTNLSYSTQVNSTDWIPAEPTPFSQNKTTADDESSDANSDSDSSGGSGSNSGSGSSSGDNDSTHSSTEKLTNYKPKIELKVSAGRERHGTINSPIEFKLTHNLDSDSGISAVWSTGDGEQLKGDEVKYSYKNAGVYNVVLNVEKDDLKAVSRTKVYISETDISLDYQKSGKTVDVLLKNDSSKEINIGGFELVFNGAEDNSDSVKNSSEKNTEYFEIAHDTIIEPKSTLILTSEITDFPYSSGEIKLYYPNRKKFAEVRIRESENKISLDQTSITEISKYIDPARKNDFERVVNLIIVE